MKFVLFTHSLRSDWNHGNAHFLRGICSELISRGHEVRVLEPEDSWSAKNLALDRGVSALEEYKQFYPGLNSEVYSLGDFEPRPILWDADVVIVHEWSDHELVARIGEHHKTVGGYRLLFHDTHHRSVTAPQEMEAYDLSGYDGVLAFGEVIRRTYLNNGWAKRAWTWHEAADTRVFRPLVRDPVGDLVWIGNWGDEERTAELHEFLLDPVRELGLKATVYGVRYPEHALKALDDAGIAYGGSIANYRASEAFAKHRVTVHVPRRPYVEALPGIPTIRPFEAMACGIPLISAPWDDSEHLFQPGIDFLVARNGADMRRMLEEVLEEPAQAHETALKGRERILQRHTCGHRVDELMTILQSLNGRQNKELEAVGHV